MRVFFAVVPPRPVREAVELIRDPLKEAAPGGRWVHPSLWHLTLKFLGEVEDDLVPAIGDLAAEIVARHVSFELSLRNLGMFPNAERPKVLWVGTEDGAEEIAAIARDLDEGLDGLGFEPEGKPYRAHLTIARFRDPHEAGELASMIGPSDEIGRFEVEEIVLMQSVLRPRGPDYSVLEKLPLEPRERPATEAAEGESEAEPSEVDEPEPATEDDPA